MIVEGGCYCAAIRYRAEGEPGFRAQCHCRECQYITGGAPNMFMIMPSSGFSYTKGTAKAFTRSDIDNPVTREFCANCGTHLLTKSPRAAGNVVIKVGSMDEPGQYPGPQVAIYCIDKQSFHHIPDGLPEFERLPP